MESIDGLKHREEKSFNSALPRVLPETVLQLIKELDKLNPPVTLMSPPSSDDLIELSYRIGRRSVVDELLRLT